MSNCGNCRNRICTCSFQGDSVTAQVLGNGSIYAPFQGRPITPSYRPVGQASRVATFAITANIDTAVTFTERDLDGVMPEAVDMFKIATPTRLTAPIDGIYLVGGQASQTSPASGHFLHVWIAKNAAPGIPYFKRTVSKQTNDSIPIPNSTIGLIDLVAGDYIELYVRTNVTGSLTGTASGSAPLLWAQWMGV